jgi:hypothetical protein
MPAASFARDHRSARQRASSPATDKFRFHRTGPTGRAALRLQRRTSGQAASMPSLRRSGAVGMMINLPRRKHSMPVPHSGAFK